VRHEPHQSKNHLNFAETFSPRTEKTTCHQVYIHWNRVKHDWSIQVAVCCLHKAVDQAIHFFPLDWVGDIDEPRDYSELTIVACSHSFFKTIA